MFKRLVICPVTIMLFAAMLQVHGDATHLMGTVTADDANTVTMKDKDGKSVVVMLEKTTKYLKDKKVAGSGDLKVGTRVVIDAKMDEKMKMYTAEEVRIGVATAAADSKVKADAHEGDHTSHK